MTAEEIENQIIKLRYSIQDLDSQISRTDIPEIQICSARQLAETYSEKEKLSKKRDLLRLRHAEAESLRSLSQQNEGKRQDIYHKENKRLGWISIATDVGLAILGKIIK